MNDIMIDLLANGFSFGVNYKNDVLHIALSKLTPDQLRMDRTIDIHTADLDVSLIRESVSHVADELDKKIQDREKSDILTCQHSFVQGKDAWYCMHCRKAHPILDLTNRQN